MAMLAFALSTLFTSPSISASPVTSYILTTAKFSLGNSSCISMECNIAPVYFYIPHSTELPQYLRFVIVPECFGQSPTANETWKFQMYCSSGFNETIDMKPYMCDPSNPIIRWVNFTTTDSKFFYNNAQYFEHWCAFKRDASSIERLPVEMTVTIDSLGILSETQETTQQIQKQAGSTIIQGIKNIFMINFNIIQIMFYLGMAIAIVLALIMLVIAIPLAIKRILRGFK